MGKNIKNTFVFKKMILMFIFLFIYGCSSSTKIIQEDLSYVKFLSTKKTNAGILYQTGSGSQWNDDYVVTVNHVNWGKAKKNIVYSCDSGCDLKFIKSKAKNYSPVWRTSIPYENLTAVGVIEIKNLNSNSIKRRTNIVSGKDANEVSLIENSGENIVKLAIIDTKDGMSGGPLYSDDKKIVGILIGQAIADVGGKKQKVAVYMPYEVIKSQWEKYKSKIN